MKKILVSIIIVATLAVVTLAQSSQAAEIELLDQGIYGYVGLGVGIATRTGSTDSGEYTQDPSRKALALGNDAQSYASLNVGMIWKRNNIPGWQSAFQISYRPLSFTKSSGGVTHRYGQRIISVDFIESYGYFNGWMPYVGLSLSSFALSFNDSSDGNSGESGQVAQLGFVGGWDIVPKPTSRFRIRTNFRWHPSIKRDYQGARVVFPNFEVEPIQFIIRF